MSYFAPYVLKNIIVLYDSNNLTSNNIFLLIACYVIFISIEPLYFIIENKVRISVEEMIKKDFSIYVFDYMLNNDIEYFNKNYSGDLTTKFISLRNGFSRIFKRILNITSALLFFIITLIIVFSFSIPMVVITVLWLTLFYFSMKKSTAILMERFKNSSEASNKSIGIINDCLINISNIKAFSHEKIESKNVKKQSLNIIRSAGNAVGINSFVMFLVYIMKNGYFFIMLSFSFYLFKQNKISLGEFMFMFQIFRILANFMRSGLDNFIKLSPEIAKFQNSLDKIFIEPNIKDKNQAKELEVSIGKIIFKDIKFSYYK